MDELLRLLNVLSCLDDLVIHANFFVTRLVSGALGGLS